MVLTWLQHNVHLKNIMTKMLMTPISFTTRMLFLKRILLQVELAWRLHAYKN